MPVHSIHMGVFQFLVIGLRTTPRDYPTLMQADVESPNQESCLPEHETKRIQNYKVRKKRSAHPHPRNARSNFLQLLSRLGIACSNRDMVMDDIFNLVQLNQFFVVDKLS